MEGKQVAVQVGLLADQVIRPNLALGQGQHEAITSHDEFADGGTSEALTQDVSHDGRHPA